MRIYLAARYSRLPIINEWAEQLKELGHEVVSRWSLGESHLMPGEISKQAADSERERFALEDWEDLMACDCIISMQEEPRNDGRGGRLIEFGIALQMGVRNIIIGPRETVFHHLPQIEHFETWEEAFHMLAAEPYVMPLEGQKLDMMRERQAQLRDRMGRFTISADALFTGEIYRILSLLKFVPTEVNYRFDGRGDIFEYEGMSPMFRVKDVGVIPPNYSITIQSHHGVPIKVEVEEMTGGR